MTRTLSIVALAALWLPSICPAQAQAQAPAAAAAPAAATQPSPLLKLPDVSDIKLPMPGAVRAANALIGIARQRLALVIGNGELGRQPLLGAASRDTQAVAAALRAAGFVVMVREGLGANELRANLKEFRDRLQPGGVGFLYFTGLGARVGGENFVLPRGLRLDDSAPETGVKAAAVPLQELIDAVQGTTDSPRYLVVDAAYAVPALAPLRTGGLAAQKLPPGLLALYAAAPGQSVPPPPEAAALPQPAPSDPRRIAASLFGRELVRSLVTPRINGAEVLRLTRSGTLEASQGKQVPFIDGETQDKDEFAEPDMLDSVLPHSPADLAREAVKQGLHMAGSSHAGDMPVSAFASPPAPAPAPAPVDTQGDSSKSQNGSDAPRAGLNAPANALAGTAAAMATAAAAATLADKVTQAAAAAGTLSSVAALAETAAGGAVQAKPSSAERPPETAPAPPTPAATAQTAGPAQPPRADSGAANPAALAQALAPADERTQVQRDGGERPNFVPRVNPFGYAEGDTFSYRVLDTWKDQLIGSLVEAIDEVLADGTLRANDQQTQLDPQGRITSVNRPDGSRSQFKPAQELFWSHPKRGESRRVHFDEFFQRADHSSGQTEWKGWASVGSPRKIQLPAGEYEVLPIESSGWYYEKLNGAYNSGQWSRTVWYSTRLGHPVAIDIEDADRLGKLLRRQRIELTQEQTTRAP